MTPEDYRKKKTWHQRRNQNWEGVTRKGATVDPVRVPGVLKLAVITMYMEEATMETVWEVAREVTLTGRLWAANTRNTSALDLSCLFYAA